MAKPTSAPAGPVVVRSGPNVAAPSEAAPNRWRGIPQDERQAARRRVVIETGFELLGSLGVAGITVRGVCETARLNPRYFYESFDDLDALLVAVFNRTADDAFAVMVAAVIAVADSDPLTVTRAGLGSFLRHVTEDPRRVQVLFVEGLGNETMSRRRLESMMEMAEFFERVWAEKSELESGNDSVDPILKIAASLIVGGMSELVITWMSGRLNVSLDDLIEDASALFVGVGETANAIAEARWSSPMKASPKLRTT